MILNRQNRAEGTDGEHVADFAGAELAMYLQEGPQQQQPRAPNRVLQEHHGREACLQQFGGHVGFPWQGL